MKLVMHNICQYAIMQISCYFNMFADPYIIIYWRRRLSPFNSKLEIVVFIFL